MSDDTIAILLIISLAFIWLSLLLVYINSAEGTQELNKDCVKFSDGKTAIVLTESGITDDFKLVWCDGSDVAWFISKGYHIDSEQSSLGPIDQVYLTR